MRRGICFLFLLYALMLTACTQKDERTEASKDTEAVVEAIETTVSDSLQKSDGNLTVQEEPKASAPEVSFVMELDLDNRIIYGAGYVPDRIYADSVDWGEANPFSVYDGYYSYCDENAYNCLIRMEGGCLHFDTRGEQPVDQTTQMYVENEHVYVELDGKTIQLGKKDMYSLEYAKEGDYFPSYITLIPDEYVELMYTDQVERIKNAKAQEEKAMKELAEARKQAELEAQKLAAEEEAKRVAQEEAQRKAAEEKEAQAAERRNTAGWVKAKVSSWTATQGYSLVSIEIIESKCEGVNAGDIITFEGTDGDDCGCTNDFGYLFLYGGDGFQSGGGNGVAFELILQKHACGRSGYVVAQFIG